MSSKQKGESSGRAKNGNDFRYPSLTKLWPFYQHHPNWNRWKLKSAFIHPRPIMNCRLPSLPEFSLIVPELLLCNTANRRTAQACTCALQEQILYWGCSWAFTTTWLSIHKEIRYGTNYFMFLWCKHSPLINLFSSPLLSSIICSP